MTEGSCLCGSVTLSMNPEQKAYGVCHCGMCRKWGGGPFMSIDAGTDVKIKGQEHVLKYKSSDWAQRGFCKTCGTHLFYLLNNQQYYVASGLFKEADDYQFTHQVFIDMKPKSYNFAEKTHTMTQDEVFKQFNG